MMRYLILFLFCVTANAATYYVSPTGSDAADGSIGTPFLTLGKARDTLRTQTPPTTSSFIYLRSGTHLLPTTLTFSGSQDSGSSSNGHVTWMAYPGETATVVGGLPLTNWQTYSGSIKAVNVSTQGITATYFSKLVCDGYRQIMARYPNYNASDPYGAGYSYVQTTGDLNEFTYASGDIRSMANPTNAQIFIFPLHNWQNDILYIQSINTGTRLVTTKANANYAMTTGDRYYYQNAFEELDAPGEWYLNTNGMCYFWPSNSAAVYAPLVDTMFYATACSNITFKNITMMCANGSAFVFSNCVNVVAGANVIKAVGSWQGGANELHGAVELHGGTYNGAVGNDISYVGKDGIALSGGTVTTLTAANNYADNNWIQYVGVDHKAGVGVNLKGVGNRASRNYCLNGPRAGIHFEGQNLLIQSNHIYNVMLETDDGGGVYAYQINWLGSHGSQIFYNYIHDVPGWGFSGGSRYTPSEAHGIYLDGATSGVDIGSNIVARSSGSGIFFNGGSYNHVTNNIVYNCTHGAGSVVGYNATMDIVGFLTNGTWWAANIADMTAGYNSVSGEAAWANIRGINVSPWQMDYGDIHYTIQSNYFWKNILMWDNTALGGDFYLYCYNVGYAKNVWGTNNVYFAGGSFNTPTNSNPITWAEWQGIPEDAGSVTTDPQLNATTWLVAAGSPALSLGYQQIYTNSIGCYNDSMRASWPLGDYNPAPPGPHVVGNIRVGTGVKIGTGVIFR